jgi:hypothetical protein
VHTITKQPATKAQTLIEGTPTKGTTEDTLTPKGRTAPTVFAGIGLAYEWFLELPVWVVVLALWVGGVALLGACALVVYAAVSALVGIVTGAY